MSIFGKLFGGQDAPRDEPTISRPEAIDVQPLDERDGGICEATDGIDCVAPATKRVTIHERLETVHSAFVGHDQHSFKACDHCASVNAAGVEDDTRYYQGS